MATAGPDPSEGAVADRTMLRVGGQRLVPYLGGVRPDTRSGELTRGRKHLFEKYERVETETGKNARYVKNKSQLCIGLYPMSDIYQDVWGWRTFLLPGRRDPCCSFTSAIQAAMGPRFRRHSVPRCRTLAPFSGPSRALSSHFSFRW